MNQDRIWTHRLQNLLHSALLLGAMVALLALLGGLFFGDSGGVLAAVAMAAVLALGGVSPRWVLRMHRARPIAPREAPGLYRLVGELAERAGLRSVPGLYLVPSPVPNALAVGSARDSAIGVTDGLLRTLDRRELAGVLAHEISHVRHRDLWVMGLARMLGSMTHGLSTFGQLMLLISLPAMLVAGYRVPWLALLLLAAAPTVSALLQLALSRTREFEADLGAARLTGDPLALASALERIERQTGGWWRMFFPLPHRRRTSFLDSHPATAERVARLRSLLDRPAPQGVPVWTLEPALRPAPRVVRLPGQPTHRRAAPRRAAPRWAAPRWAAPRWVLEAPRL